MRITSLNVWPCAAMTADPAAQDQCTTDHITGRFV
jgi:hypothetical protein